MPVSYFPIFSKQSNTGLVGGHIIAPQSLQMTTRISSSGPPSSRPYLIPDAKKASHLQRGQLGRLISSMLSSGLIIGAAAAGLYGVFIN
jgi:hypothetical protein